MNEPSLTFSSCPDEAAIGRLLVGEIASEERLAILGHAADCEPCCDLLAALQSTSKPRTAPTMATTTVDRYRIIAPLGAGGSGVVYAAHDTRLDRRVALKVLHEDATEQVLREARAMARLSHPNVVRVFDVGVAAGHVFVAMELVEGGTLRAWLAEAPRPWRAIIDRFVEAGRGLAAAHRAGMIHRDFKPANLLVREGTMLVTDFGLARMVARDEVTLTEGARLPLGHWEATNIAGTPMYMAPEQIRGESLDARADVFSFSVTLWESLYGARPFVGTHADDLLAAIAKGPPPLAKSDVPSRIARALTRGMSFDRESRHVSIEALLAECEEPPKARGNVGAKVIAAAAILSAVVIGARVSLPTPTPPPPVPPPPTTTTVEPPPTNTLSLAPPPPSASTSSPPPPSATATATMMAPKVTVAPPPSTSHPPPATDARGPISEGVPGPMSMPLGPRPTVGLEHPPVTFTPPSLPQIPAFGSAPSQTGREATATPSGWSPKPKTQYVLTRLEPFGEEAAAARKALESQISRFDACLAISCVEEQRAEGKKTLAVCRFGVDGVGRVTSADCPHFLGDRRISCMAGERCTAAALRGMALPRPSEGGGQCSIQVAYTKR